MEREEKPFTITSPFSIQIIGSILLFQVNSKGPSQSGKTTFMLRILDSLEELVDHLPEKIYWASTSNDVQLPQYITRIQGMPNLDDIQPNSLLILDDLGNAFAHDKKAARALEVLATVATHHKRVSTCSLLQNAFSQNRTSRVNATHLVFMRSHSDTVQMRTVGRQIFPSESDLILKAMRVANRLGERYVMLSIHPAEEKIRLVTRIFPGEDTVFFEEG